MQRKMHAMVSRKARCQIPLREVGHLTQYNDHVDA
jgi:hypothetical protein